MQSSLLAYFLCMCVCMLLCVCVFVTKGPPNPFLIGTECQLSKYKHWRAVPYARLPVRWSKTHKRPKGLDWSWTEDSSLGETEGQRPRMGWKALAWRPMTQKWKGPSTHKDPGLKPVYTDRRPKRDRYLQTKLGGKLEAHDPESRKDRSPKTKGNSKMRTLNRSSFLLFSSLRLDIFSSPFPVLISPFKPTSFEMSFLMLLLL